MCGPGPYSYLDRCKSQPKGAAMTGQLSAQVAHHHVMDMIHEAEQHRRTHAAQLDRLSGRWIPFSRRSSRSAIAPALATHKPCN
jgi:hypothetical protein